MSSVPFVSSFPNSSHLFLDHLLTISSLTSMLGRFLYSQNITGVSIYVALIPAQPCVLSILDAFIFNEGSPSLHSARY